MPNKDEQARYLARKHYELEDTITQIVRLTAGEDAETDPDEPIKLLEVNEITIPSGVLPLGFGPVPSAGIHYSSVIIEVTPDEFEKIRSNELKLPKDWKLGAAIPRDVETLAP